MEVLPQFCFDPFDPSLKFRAKGHVEGDKLRSGFFKHTHSTHNNVRCLKQIIHVASRPRRGPAAGPPRARRRAVRPPWGRRGPARKTIINKMKKLIETHIYEFRTIPGHSYWENEGPGDVFSLIFWLKTNIVFLYKKYHEIGSNSMNINDHWITYDEIRSQELIFQVKSINIL